MRFWPGNCGRRMSEIPSLVSVRCTPDAYDSPLLGDAALLPFDRNRGFSVFGDHCGLLRSVHLRSKWTLTRRVHFASMDSLLWECRDGHNRTLTPQARKELKEIGWTKGRELAKLARRDGQRFNCAPWVHKARHMRKEDFRREVDRELAGKDEEPSELIYFKVYKSQIPAIEQAIETAALMWFRPVTRLLSGDDLRGFLGRSQPG
jgi:hypothetical protein